MSLEIEFLGNSLASLVRVLLGGVYIIFFGLLYFIVYPFLHEIHINGNRKFYLLKIVWISREYILRCFIFLIINMPRQKIICIEWVN